MNRSIYLAGIAACVLFASGCNKGGGGSNQPAAMVNGEAITMDQFHQYLELKPQVRVVVDPSKLQSGNSGQLPQQPFEGPVVGSLGLQALSDLIQKVVLKQLAMDEKVYPTDDEVRVELEDRTKTDPSFVKNLTTAGFTLPMIREEIALQLSQFKLTTQGIVIPDADVQKYIQEHPKEFTIPESVEMVWMLVPDEKTKAAADAELKLANKFVIVAQKYSVAPNARTMAYHFPETRVPALANYGPDLMPAVQKTPEQQMTPWIKFTEGWAKFYINKKSAERKMPIDDALLKKVKRALALQKGNQARDLNQRIQEKLKASKIDIMVGTLKDPWKAQMDALAGNTAPAAGK